MYDYLHSGRERAAVRATLGGVKLPHPQRVNFNSRHANVQPPRTAVFVQILVRIEMHFTSDFDARK